MKSLRTYLGRVIRDIGRKIGKTDGLREIFAQPLALARQVREQRPRQRGHKVYSLHAPEGIPPVRTALRHGVDPWRW